LLFKTRPDWTIWNTQPKFSCNILYLWILT
jgi:hypothetical protein